MGSEIQTMRASCKHDSTFMTPTWFFMTGGKQVHVSTCVSTVQWVRYTRSILIRTKPVWVQDIVSTGISMPTMEATRYILPFSEMLHSLFKNSMWRKSGSVRITGRKNKGVKQSVKKEAEWTWQTGLSLNKHCEKKKRYLSQKFNTSLNLSFKK